MVDGTTGREYEREYDGWLATFQMLASTDQPFELENVPSCWAPFLMYLGHTVATIQPVDGWELEHVEWLAEYLVATDPRRVVEVASTCRPELVHALYCADTVWPCPLRRCLPKKAFPVTCNGSFFRHEVRTFRRLLEAYWPNKTKAVVVPCSADKPYPSRIHQEVIKRLPDDSWHLVVAAGVLGLVPQELWSVMPQYDAGLPNPQRVTDTFRWYFSKHRYEAIVVFSDFYGDAVKRGLEEASSTVPIEYIFGSHYRDTYENLLLTEHLDRLEQSMRRVSF